MDITFLFFNKFRHFKKKKNTRWLQLFNYFRCVVLLCCDAKPTWTTRHVHLLMKSLSSLLLVHFRNCDIPHVVLKLLFGTRTGWQRRNEMQTPRASCGPLNAARGRCVTSHTAWKSKSNWPKCKWDETPDAEHITKCLFKCVKPNHLSFIKVC